MNLIVTLLGLFILVVLVSLFFRALAAIFGAVDGAARAEQKQIEWDAGSDTVWSANDIQAEPEPSYDPRANSARMRELQREATARHAFERNMEQAAQRSRDVDRYIEEVLK